MLLRTKLLPICYELLCSGPDHDAEFVSFNPTKGEWKFKVKNFRNSSSGTNDKCSHIIRKLYYKKSFSSKCAMKIVL